MDALKESLILRIRAGLKVLGVIPTFTKSNKIQFYKLLTLGSDI